MQSRALQLVDFPPPHTVDLTISELSFLNFALNPQPLNHAWCIRSSSYASIRFNGLRPKPDPKAQSLRFRFYGFGFWDSRMLGPLASDPKLPNPTQPQTLKVCRV